MVLLLRTGCFGTTEVLTPGWNLFVVEKYMQRKLHFYKFGHGQFGTLKLILFSWVEKKLLGP